MPKSQLPDTFTTIGDCPVDREGTYLGFDFGLKQIGIAIGQPLCGYPRELTRLKANNGVPQWEAIAALIQEWAPTGCVVGLPLHEGQASQMSHRAKKFANRLREWYQIPVIMIDESHSTRMAKTLSGLSTSAVINKTNQVDGLAAAIILQRWFEANGIG